MTDTPNTPILPEGDELDILMQPTESSLLGSDTGEMILPQTEITPLEEVPTDMYSAVTTQTAGPSTSVSMTEDIASVDFDNIEAIGEGVVESHLSSDFVEPSELPQMTNRDMVTEDTPPILPIESPSNEEIIPEVVNPFAPIQRSQMNPASSPTHTDTKSHKKLIIGGVGVIVLLVILGAWAIFGGTSTTKKEVVDYTISNEDAPMDYAATIALQIKQDEQDIGYMNQAMTTMDSAICSQIQSEAKKVECTEGITAVKLSLSGSVSECAALTLTDVRNRCVSTISQKEAIATMNKTLCDTIVDVTQSQYCRESIDERTLASIIETKTATPENCKKLESKYQESCLATIVRVDDNGILQDAIKNDNIDACKKLSTEDLQFTCFDTILLKRALVSKDKNLCDLVRDTTKKASCITYTSQQDDNTVFKNAIINKDLPACSRITSEALKNRCNDSVILLVVRDTKDGTLCKKLINTESDAACKKAAGIQ